jgi:gamma-glutamylcysteine synthetase
MNCAFDYFHSRLKAATADRSAERPRIGIELKFPLVRAEDGSATDLSVIEAFWRYLAADRGWTLCHDEGTGKLTGARKPGEQNDSVASCETGVCKPEFSLAHVDNLFDLQRAIDELRGDIGRFARRHDVRFLGYGIQPITPPSERLMMKKTRTSVWDRVFGANRILAPEDGDDVCLFTANAATHVHVGLTEELTVRAVNVLNGFSGAQLALTADSSVWRGAVDNSLKCVAEKFWDWWMLDSERVGVPSHRFGDLRDYVETIARFAPVYVKRDGAPILLSKYRTLAEYFADPEPTGTALDGEEVELEPDEADLALHNTCYWFNARISGYYTVENRTNDQQPPDQLATIAALTLGLTNALDECEEELAEWSWQNLRQAREQACRTALQSDAQGVDLAALAGRMVELACLGLTRRGLGEEIFLDPFERRLRTQTCPADDAARLFATNGIAGLVQNRAFQ